MSLPCGVTAEQLARFPDDEKQLVRDLIGILPVQDMIDQQLCNVGAEYMSNTLFLAVQWKHHKIHNPNGTVEYKGFQKATYRAWKILDKNLQGDWKAAASEIKQMERTTG
jgi:hypothetical protein